MSRSEQFSSFFDEFLEMISQHNVTSLGEPPLHQAVSWAGGGARQFGGGGGCNDAYSAFAFLSFLFALLTFIQNNQAAGGRRRREADQQVEVILSTSVTTVLGEACTARWPPCRRVGWPHSTPCPRLAPCGPRAEVISQTEGGSFRPRPDGTRLGL